MFKRIKHIRFNSIRFKFSLFYTAILAVILFVYTIILYFGQRYALYRDLDRQLAIKAQEIANAINSFLPVSWNDQRSFRFAASIVVQQEGTLPDIEKNIEAKRRWMARREELGLRNDYIVLTSTEGESITNSQNVDEKLLINLSKSTSAATPKAVQYRNVYFAAHRLRMITIPYYYKNKYMYSIQVGSSLKPITKILYGRTFFALLIIPVVLVFSMFFGGAIADRILGPVMHITDIAKTISYKDLSARVKLQDVDAELRYLVHAFNEMIARLDKSFRYISEFSSNVAHELKTPLTIIRGESELALMQERNVQEYQRVININLETAEEMLKIVEDLLLLSKLEYQPDAFNFDDLDFGSFIRETVEQAKKMAAQKNISIKLSGDNKPTVIRADGVHLKRLFLNLLNNAVRFTPEKGNITVNVQKNNKKLRISVSDTGAGIKPEHINKIFDRFYRTDASRSGSEGGSGLGLSIALSIAKIHGGDISVKSTPNKGSTFTVTLPT